jgi:Tfp pilus assembly protein PilN
MSRMSGNGRVRAGGVLVVHDGPWGRRVLVMTSENGSFHVPVARCLENAGALSLQQLAQEHGVTRVVRIAPARETVARVSVAPAAGTDEQRAQAAMLLAEAELPAAVPPYRRTAGVVGEPSEGEMSVLMTAWLSPVAPDALTSLPETWTTPVAALAALAESTGRLVVWADRREGTICLVLPGPGRFAVRVFLEFQQDEAAWRESIRAAVEETALAAGLAGPPAIPARGRALLLDGGLGDRILRRVTGEREDPAWLDEFGIALGAALLAIDERATHRQLTSILGAPPVIARSGLAMWIEGLRSPARAGTLIAASIALATGGSLGLAWARAEVLGARVKKIEVTSGGREKIEAKADLYATLESLRLPMTKLIMDVSRAAPEGVVIQSLRIAPGQGLTLRGQAENGAQVGDFKATLSRTRVFSDVTVGRQESKGEVVEFDLTAKIARPHEPVKDAEDFAQKTLFQRLYPEGVPPTPVPAPARTARPVAGETRAASGPPPPVSDEEISRMDRATAMRGWALRQSYVRRNPGLDPAVRDRLQEEATKLRARMDALNTGGPR